MIRQRLHFFPGSGEEIPSLNMCETKKRMLESAARLKGDSPATDSQTARLVHNALTWSPFLADVTFTVTVINGTVILTGSSPYPPLARMAMMIAYTVPGVRHVIDNITAE